MVHPFTNRIADELTKGRRHVILTGHAGDGKSTIGLELFKRFSALPANEPLERDLRAYEEINSPEGKKIALIKDFSEWTTDDQEEIIKNAGGENQPRTLLISNTGTLLDAFRRVEQKCHGDWIGLESKLLETFSRPEPDYFEFHGVGYLIINLAMYDNLNLARQIFQRMLHPDCWQSCTDCERQSRCPIYANIKLMQNNLHMVLDRIFLLYRRMFEYGQRFTLRQLTAHLAYMITSGIEHVDIVKLGQRPKPPLFSEFMFFNRFFGDNGRQPDQVASQIKVINTIRSQEFGKQPCPSWERKMWLHDYATAKKFDISDKCPDFDILCRVGAGEKISAFYQDEKDIPAAREQIRRSFYFLHHFDNAEDIFLSFFTRSPMLLEFAHWHTSTYSMSTGIKNKIKKRVIHVLQEHFTGIRIPEGSFSENKLYITLSRNSEEIRQGAQVVLAYFDEDDFEICLEKITDGTGCKQQQLVFRGVDRYETAALALELPFLDYVMMRHRGETGQILQTAFIDRLDRFKAQLISLNRKKNKHDVILIRLRTNHTFHRQQISFDNGYLEVSDA